MPNCMQCCSDYSQNERGLTKFQSDFLGGIGDAAIGGEALAALADGFESFDGNAILTIGHGVDVDKVLTDESLDNVDSPTTRKKLHKVFLSVFSELCRYIDDVFDHFQGPKNAIKTFCRTFEMITTFC